MNRLKSFASGLESNRIGLGCDSVGCGVARYVVLRNDVAKSELKLGCGFHFYAARFTLNKWPVVNDN